MKTQLAIAAALVSMFSARQIAPAATTNIYVENWGTGNINVSTPGISSVGWTAVAVSETIGPPYIGIYPATGATDAETGDSLPANTVYFTQFPASQTNPGMFYTTDGAGSGVSGNSAFTTINPTLYTNLALSVEERNGGGAPGTNYFAVQVGGLWYVATSYVMPDFTGGYPMFTNATLVYTNPANVWNSLTINATDVTIGGVASPNLTSPITGVGIVVTPTSGQPNFNRFAVQAFAPNPPPPNPPTNSFAVASQTVYKGGGVSLVTRFTGTAPLSYSWKTNGVSLPAGGKYLGTTNNTLTITNVTADDATANGVVYSVTATNLGGMTNSPVGALTVNVLPRPSDMIYSETLPYVGPNGDLPLTGVGWVTAFAPGGLGGIFSLGSGDGENFDYSGFTTTSTNASYVTVESETGLSGLPFTAIDIASTPTITFQASFRAGNGGGAPASAVTRYWAVRVNGSWYASVQPVSTIDLSPTVYQTNQYAFKTAATNWYNLTISGNTVTFGSVASSDLSGTIDGAGLVFAHHDVNSSVNFDNFLLLSSPVTVNPPAIGVNGAPWSQNASTGGGVSFGVAASGTPPFTYGWTLNGTVLNDGGRIFGSKTPMLTIANVTPADQGQVIAWVTNAAGVDDSLNSPNGGGGFDTQLTVTDPAVGTLYTETFQFIGPLPGNFPISSAGWDQAVPNDPFTLFQRIGNDAAAFAYLGNANTTVYYTSTATDTNQAGLPFPNINLAAYPDLTFSVDIAPTFSSSNVTAYPAIQIGGSSWYVAATALPVPTAFDDPNYTPYQTPFNAAAANWKHLTINADNGSIGATASSDLSGVMTGFGLVFVTVGTGGNFNFDNIAITGSGLGAINAGPLSGGSFDLSWVGNPAVGLVCATNLASPVWVDVPNTMGLYSYPVTPGEPQKYFRLKQP